MKKALLYLFILLLIVFYYFFRHEIRPFLRTYNNQNINFFLSIFPNFFGAFILFIFVRYIYLKSTKSTFRFVLFYAIFHESMNHFFDKIKFDPYDVLATFVALIVMLLVDYKLNNFKDYTSIGFAELFNFKNNV